MQERKCLGMAHCATSVRRSLRFSITAELIAEVLLCSAAAEIECCNTTPIVLVGLLQSVLLRCSGIVREFVDTSGYTELDSSCIGGGRNFC